MVNLGTPCDLGGNDLPPNTPPVSHDEPDGTGPSWHPFKSRAQFELADFIFHRDQMSGGRIDELMDILATMDEGGTPPFSNHKELYSLIEFKSNYQTQISRTSLTMPHVKCLARTTNAFGQIL